MLKHSESEELVSGNGHEYKFAGNFGFAETLSLMGRDVMFVHADLSIGVLPAKDIKNVIMCAMVAMDGLPVIEESREKLAIEFIEDFGLQDSSVLARMLITHAIIGNVKKKQLIKGLATTSLTEKLSLSRSMISKKLGLLLAAGVAILAALLSMILIGSSALI